MIEKQKGKINELVYDHTVYFREKQVIFPTIGGLYVLLDDLIEAKATTAYVRITPFYRNTKINQQIEFDDFMFFLECKTSIAQEEEMAAILERLDDNPFLDLSAGKALQPMCQFDDPQKFGRSLAIYRDYLETVMPQMFAVAKEELNLQEEDFAFGYFSFEIHSE